MEQFLLASHGSLARAMKETAAFLLGTNENVHCLCAYVDEASMNLEQMVGEWAAGRKTEEHWTVITDIFGGSVNNEFMKYAGDPGVNLVAGMSLPLVIGLLNQPGQVGPDAICRLPRYLTKPRQRRSEWDMAGSDGISRVSAVFRGKSLLTNKMRII